MENGKKPENLKIYRKKGLTVFGAALCLLLAAALIALVVVAYILTDDETLREVRASVIIAFVGIGFASAVLVLLAALNIRNLFYPLVLATDERGLYDYSGYVHCGFVAWEDIKTIYGGGNTAETFSDILLDGDIAAVKIELKNGKRAFSSRSGLWRAIFFLSGFGSVKIRTLCSPLSKKRTYALLAERSDYYSSTELKD